MTTVSRENFGFLIAYLIPGFTIVGVLSSRSPAIQHWLGFTSGATPTVGGFLYVTIASIAAGMTLGAIRWLLLDRIHQATGIRLPRWNFPAVHEKRAAFDYLVDMHYRYYEFFGHMFLALIAMMANTKQLSETMGMPSYLLLTLLGLISALLFVASRDTLRKYYERSAVLLK